MTNIDLISTLSVAVGMIGIIITILFGVRSIRNIRSEQKKELEETLEKLRSKKSLETGGAVTELSVEEERYALFTQYHTQGLEQSKISFWFSLIFAAIGFIIICIGIFTVQVDKNILDQGRAFLSLISGTIIDAVSALFFIQSNKARQLMIAFFDKLRADRKFEESLNLASQIADSELKSRIKVLLSIHFAELSPTDETMRLILVNSEDNAQTSTNDG